MPSRSHILSECVVGISEARVSADATQVLVAHSLGSCMGIGLYDPGARVGGLLHALLPTSDMDPGAARVRPAMFVDTGLTHLLEGMAAAGASLRRCQVVLVGAAQILDHSNFFQIGRRNYAAARRALWQRGLFISREEIGRTVPRTVRLHVGTGEFVVAERGGAPKPVKEVA